MALGIVAVMELSLLCPAVLLLLTSAVASWFSEDSKVVAICVRTSYVIGIFAFADGMMSVCVIYLGLPLAYTLFFHTSLGVVGLTTGIVGAITQMSCLLSNCTGRHVSSIFSLPAMRPLKR
jgi:Na+-driven multidrug efflux pump